ncbi:hypothetical protein CRG98_026994 [Punica granatum]|uniref:Uncharacterized protein n=1 Tax=Punica granatum TaxID=22663 RepID=A0A2I0J8S9_PUNGR|nr:hypothetical protein CRG98_026994 [Punica granatum]
MARGEIVGYTCHVGATSAQPLDIDGKDNAGINLIFANSGIFLWAVVLVEKSSGTPRKKKKKKKKKDLVPEDVWPEPKKGEGLGPSVGDPNPTTEVTCTHIGCRRPWRWGQGRRLEALAPESIGISNSRSRSIRGLRPPIGDLNPTLKVFGVLCGCRQPRWCGRDRRLEAQVPSPFFCECYDQIAKKLKV